MPNYAFFRHDSGQRYLIPHWIPIGEDVTYENILDHIPYEFLHPESIRPPVKEYPVPGRPYTITVTSTKTSCSCPGFQFRNRCKHTTAFMENTK